MTEKVTLESLKAELDELVGHVKKLGVGLNMMNKLGDSLSSIAEKAGGMDGMVRRLDEGENRTRLMNLKLTLLLERAEVDWRKDPRIEELQKKK